jgi:hypothetical protein
MPAHRFYRFGKHYRAGLQARSAFQVCEIKGVRFPAKAWSKAAATLQNGYLEMKGVRDDKPQEATPAVSAAGRLQT